MTPDFLDAIGRITGPVALGIALIGVYRRWWVPGWLYDQVLAERDKAYGLLEQAALNSGRAVDAAVKANEGDGHGLA